MKSLTREEVRSIIASTSPIRLNVSMLWQEYGCQRWWGERLPSAAWLVSQPAFARALAGDAPLPEPVEGIAGRIRANRAQLGEIIIGPAGDLWLGMETIAFLYLQRVAEIDAIVLGDLPPTLLPSPLDSVFHPTFLSRLASGELAGAMSSHPPFPHAYISNVLQADVADAIATELPSLSWQLVETDLYDQYVETLLDPRHLNSGSTLARFRRAVLSDDFRHLARSLAHGRQVRVGDVATHKSTTGQSIGVHTDFSEDREIGRITLHFNPHWQHGEGGLFQACSELDPGSVVRQYLPEHNTAVVFRVSPRSFHCVTPVTSQRARYSTVITLVDEQ